MQGDAAEIHDTGQRRHSGVREQGAEREQWLGQAAVQFWQAKAWDPRRLRSCSGTWLRPALPGTSSPFFPTRVEGQVPNFDLLEGFEVQIKRNLIEGSVLVLPECGGGLHFFCEHC